MTLWREDPLTGAPVAVVAGRQDRPHLPSEGCPFCPGGLEAPETYEVRWFPNRWPALPDGRCEVVLYTPLHDASLASLGPEGAARVVDLWAARTAALGARPDVGYVLVFENRGREVGATIDHPHGQIYAYPGIPPVPTGELARSGQGCPLCTPPPSPLLVAAHGGWSLTAAAAPGWPYELLLAPDGHVPDLPAVAADPGLRSGLAESLADAVGRLDGLFSAPMPYMLWFHQRPTDGGSWPAAHVHAHLAPVLRGPGLVRYVAAAEVGGGVMFNPVGPEEAAAALRSLAR
ncbi:MAG TPA: hypothetical protein VFH50_09905 [Acidimicrobiales bacterium]|nr:hypothetical protein [Acidimicrobiales bacterium]